MAELTQGEKHLIPPSRQSLLCRYLQKERRRLNKSCPFHSCIMHNQSPYIVSPTITSLVKICENLNIVFICWLLLLTVQLQKMLLQLKIKTTINSFKTMTFALFRVNWKLEDQCQWCAGFCRQNCSYPIWKTRE